MTTKPPRQRRKGESSRSLAERLMELGNTSAADSSASDMSAAGSSTSDMGSVVVVGGPPGGSAGGSVQKRRHRSRIRSGDEAPDALARLKTVEKTLTDSLDELNAELMRAEGALRALPVKAEARVVLDRDDAPDYVAALCFYEHRGAWSLMLVDGPEGDLMAEKPIIQAPWRIRIKAAEALPDLLEQLAENVERQAVRAQRARKKAAAFTDSLLGKEGDNAGA